ncbi:MAG: S8 family serine peptidase [Chlorobi bacterium]|nr:S8 family serine peptidase [Chlorobiota bacterium]
MRQKLQLLFLIAIVSTVLFGQTDKYTNRLEEKMRTAQPDEYIRVIIMLDDRIDIVALDRQLYNSGASLQERSYTVITKLKRKAEETQGALRRYLSKKEAVDDVFRFQAYWITNAIMTEAKPSVIEELSLKSDVDYIDIDPLLDWDRPTESSEAPRRAEKSPGGREPGLTIINAPALWAMGIIGEGQIVMNIDTGVDINHPAINYKWRGNHVPIDQAWFDPNTGSDTPTDCDSHGTHTMGTMCGLETATNDTIGVAIGAEWIAAKTICSSPHTSNSIAAFQWAIDPDGDPGTTDDMPAAISNSWYDPSANADLCGDANVYYSTLNAVEAAGIAVVFSAGNSGPSAQTITAPKNLNTDEVNIWATGAIDGSSYLGGNNNPIASFSSRGPSRCGGDGSLLIKPEASAPGVSVRSSTLGTSYGYKSGTSMASPHVAGAIALLKQFAPSLTGREIKMALYNTAVDLGTTGEDNDYGTGVIDVYAAFLSLGTPDDIPPTTITDLSVVNVYSNGYDLTWTAPSDDSQNGVVAYDIRVSDTPINNDNDFETATQVSFGSPAEAGQTETLQISGLDFNDIKYYAIKSRDIWNNVAAMSNAVMAETYGAPEISVTPEALDYPAVEVGTVFDDAIAIENISAEQSTLDYTVSLENNTFPMGAVKGQVTAKRKGLQSKSTEVKGAPVLGGGQSFDGSGGPDDGNYVWRDSDDPNGPAYVWNDISTTGTEMNFPNGNQDDGWTNTLNLGFTFDFYGVNYTSVRFTSNGLIAFEPLTSSYRTNKEIPNANAPNAFIAPFWDDLTGKNQGGYYYQQDDDKFIIQFNDLQKYYGATQGGPSGHYTFQVVLEASGKIKIYYLEMNGAANEATVGIENADGTGGLQVAYNAAYPPSDEFALQFMQEPDWVTYEDLGSGRIFNGNSAEISLTFDATNLDEGNYSLDLVIDTNAPNKSVVVVPITMTVYDPIPVELTSFTAKLEENRVLVLWETATETNNKGFEIQRKSGENGEWEKRGYIDGNGTVSERHSYKYEDKVDEKGNGKLFYRLKQIDFSGVYSFSAEVEISVLPQKYSLEQNYPNPFNPSTKIEFAVPVRSAVRIAVYNTLGEEIVELFNGVKESGYHTLEWNAESSVGGLPSGLYIYRMEATATDGSKSFYDVKKMMLLK